MRSELLARVRCPWSPVFTGTPLRKAPIGILLLLAVVFAPALHADRAAPTRVFERIPCAFALPAGIKVDCGFLVVPESREGEGEGHSRAPRKEIQIAVAIARAPSGAPLADPIVYVTGGPSAAAITQGSVFYLSKIFFGANRDLILVDQRGTGLSQPRLGCPEFDTLEAAAFPNAPSRATYLTSVRGCRDRLRAAGIDLAAYDSAENAADLDDLRVALGYDEWNVLGLSNGGLATLTLMRLHPEGIRSVVLDSPSSNDNLRVVDRWRATSRLLEKVFTGCAADPVCAGRFGDVRATFYGLLDGLRQDPVDVSIPNPAGGPSLTAHVTGDVLLSGAATLIFDPAVLPSLPGTIFFAAHGGLVPVVRAAVGTPSPSSAIFAEGKTLSTLCSDVIPFETREDLTDAARALPEFQGLILDPDVLEPINRLACEVWDVPRAHAVQHHPVRSRIPTLILSGEYDGVVSPDEGGRIAESLGHAHFYQVPGVGHIVLGGTCASGIAIRFLNSPEAAPATDCLGSLPEIVFGH